MNIKKEFYKFCESNKILITEEIIGPYISYMDYNMWNYISIYQILSEEFMEKYSDKINWHEISIYQKLSEEFIERHSDKLDWYNLSTYQKLSENLIKKFANKVDWYNIFKTQKLSEAFITNNLDKCNINIISTYQKVSEDFIEKNLDKCHLYIISKYQKLSYNFLKKHQIMIDHRINWLYKSVKSKIQYIKHNTEYEVIDDKYIIAYKTVRHDGYSVYNFQYRYEVGEVYESHCDCNANEESSFGLSAWTKDGALEYYSKGKLLKVRINIEDIGVIVHNNKKIRCCKLEILEEVPINLLE